MCDDNFRGRAGVRERGKCPVVARADGGSTRVDPGPEGASDGGSRPAGAGQPRPGSTETVN